ncbi:MAG: glycosyltransferase, partial [Isosphaeraceae bacterium]
MSAFDSLNMERMTPHHDLETIQGTSTLLGRNVSAHCTILMHSCIWGGAESHAVGLSKALVERGVSTTILCLDDRTYELFAPPNANGVELRRGSWNRPVRARGYLDWARVFRKLPRGACLFEKGTLHAGNLALEWAARRHFSKLVTIEQLEPPPLPPRSRGRHLGGLIPGLGLWWYEMRLRGHLRSRLPSMTVAVSESVRKRLHADYGFHPGKTVTIRNGADVTRFRPDPDARRAFRDRWRIPQDAFVFGTARRMTLDKGLDIAIQAFAKLPDRRDRPTPYLALVGDGPEREALVRLAESMGVADRVRFTGFSDDPASAYPAFDVFVLPSRNEALSLALVEGMACGCLPIAT